METSRKQAASASVREELTLLCEDMQPASEQNAAMKTESATMTDVEATVTSFAASARCGRRNAVTDIQDSAVGGETAGLPGKLQDLTLKEDEKGKSEETTKDEVEKPPKKDN